MNPFQISLLPETKAALSENCEAGGGVTKVTLTSTEQFAVPTMSGFMVVGEV